MTKGILWGNIVKRMLDPVKDLKHINGKADSDNYIQRNLLTHSAALYQSVAIEPNFLLPQSDFMQNPRARREKMVKLIKDRS